MWRAERTCIIKTRDGQFINTTEDNRKGFKLDDDVFNSGSRIFKLECKFKLNTTVVVRLVNYLVVLGK